MSMRNLTLSLGFLSFALAAGCSSSNGSGAYAMGASSAGGSGSGTAPSIHITSPKSGDTVSSGTDPDFPDKNVEFSVTNFKLMPPASGATACPAGTCGHVHLYVHTAGGDKTECNDPAQPYNAAGAASPIAAGFDYCKTIPGSRTILLELHNDDHSPVNGADGQVVSDSVSITVAGGGDAGTDAGTK
jgi:hypothetical protein